MVAAEPTLAAHAVAIRYGIGFNPSKAVISRTRGVKTRTTVSLRNKAERRPEKKIIKVKSWRGVLAIRMTLWVMRSKNPQIRRLTLIIIMEKRRAIVFRSIEARA